jgi:hypothetical protein
MEVLVGIVLLIVLTENTHTSLPSCANFCSSSKTSRMLNVGLPSVEMARNSVPVAGVAAKFEYLLVNSDESAACELNAAGVSEMTVSLSADFRLSMVDLGAC